ncbi:tetratricopeptide repeat protein 28-like [Lingula anatina]|uniref:Tetratricopeptide repeat protein 28-like n=1 Tax=Lingula anatina TaxID=7574 RepID=A0A2R2MNX0_LINAN|nr:tetratricopeptide repeat protein 28-like [Lingula anatina]|eukprot:XP_023931919.1 tetratricopeptide repeat protein 28-like [Lingula anatina]
MDSIIEGNQHLQDIETLVQQGEYTAALLAMKEDVESTSNKILYNFYNKTCMTLDSSNPTDKVILKSLAYQALGVVYSETLKHREKAKALPFYITAKDSLGEGGERQAKLLLKNDNVTDALMNLFETIAWCYSVKYDFKNQHDYLKGALNIAEIRGLKEKAACLLMQLGRSCIDWKVFLRASDYIYKANALAEQLDRKDIVATCLLLMQDVRVSDPYNYADWEVLEKALQIAQGLGDKFLLAKTHIYMANHRRYVDSFQISFDHATQALKIAESLDENDYDSQEILSLCLTCMSKTYILIGNNERALRFLEQNRRVLQNLGDRVRLGDVKMEIAYFTLKEARSKSESDPLLFQQAVKCCEDAIDIADEIKDKDRLCKTKYTYALLQNASSHFKRTIKLAREAKNLLIECLCHQRIVRICTKHGRFLEAQRHASACREMAHDLSTELEQIYFTLQGSLYKEQGLLEKASGEYGKAIIVASHVRERKLNDDDNKIEYFESAIECFTGQQEIYIQQQKYTEALSVAEQCRARSMLDIMYARRPKTDITNHIRGPEAIHRVVNTANVPVVVFALINDKLFAWVIRPQQDDVTFLDYDVTCPDTKVTGLLSELSVLRSLSPPSPAGIQTIPSVNWRMGGWKGRTRNNLDSVLDSSSTHDVTLMSKGNGLKKVFQRWYDGILVPVLNVLKKDGGRYSNIVIIPDLQLHLVPFPALLINDYCATVMPSLEILAHSLREDSSSSEENTQPRALVVGNPSGPEIDICGQKWTPCKLPGAEDEAILIAGMLGTEPLLRDRARLSVVKKELPRADVIHVACHGSWSETALVLSPDGSPEDGTLSSKDVYLTAEEVMEMKLRAKIVVLSACHSGSGEIKNEGVVGLSRAFLVAGAKAVVVALWQLPDQATKAFMTSFYQDLIARKTVSRALRNAMQTMQDRPRTEWASFTIVGRDVSL